LNSSLNWIKTGSLVLYCVYRYSVVAPHSCLVMMSFSDSKYEALALAKVRIVRAVTATDMNIRFMSIFFSY